MIDDDLMAGVTPHPETPETYCAFVLKHTTGEYLGYEYFGKLQDALDKINQIKRPWSFEKIGGCGGCADGKCGQGACSKKEGGCCPKETQE